MQQPLLLIKSSYVRDDIITLAHYYKDKYDK